MGFDCNPFHFLPFFLLKILLFFLFFEEIPVETGQSAFLREMVLRLPPLFVTLKY